MVTSDYSYVSCYTYISSSSTYDFLRKDKILPLLEKSTITEYLKASITGIGFGDKIFGLFKEELETYDEFGFFMLLSLSLDFHQPNGMFCAKGATFANVLAAFLLQAIMKVEQTKEKFHGFVSVGARRIVACGHSLESVVKKSH